MWHYEITQSQHYNNDVHVLDSLVVYFYVQTCIYDKKNMKTRSES